MLTEIKVRPVIGAAEFVAVGNQVWKIDIDGEDTIATEHKYTYNAVVSAEIQQKRENIRVFNAYPSLFCFR